MFIFIYNIIMLTKKTVAKKASVKIKKLSEADKKLIKQRSKEFLEWKTKNLNQKWFFSLEEREQKLLETSFAVVVQICRELTWEDYLNRLRIADTCNAKAKVVKDGALKFLHL